MPGPWPRRCSRENREAASDNRSGRCRGVRRDSRRCRSGRRHELRPPQRYTVDVPAWRQRRGHRYLDYRGPRASPRRTDGRVSRRSGDGLRGPWALRFLWDRDLAAAADRNAARPTRSAITGRPNTTSRCSSWATLTPPGRRVREASRPPTSALRPMGRPAQRRPATMPRSPAPTSRCRCIYGPPHLTLAAAAPSLLGTRCAGPLQSDIASQLARRVVDVASLSHGRTGVSLASSSDFAVHGLAGTVTSTVQLRLGRPHTHREGTGGSSSTQPKSRLVEIDYPARLNGSALIHTHGDPSSCAALGSCGANGTFALQVHGTPGTLRIFAFTDVAAAASRPACRIGTAQARKSAWHPDHRRVAGPRPGHLRRRRRAGGEHVQGQRAPRTRRALPVGDRGCCDGRLQPGTVPAAPSLSRPDALSGQRTRLQLGCVSRASDAAARSI